MYKFLKPVHPFPARMAPEIVWAQLDHRKSSVILDPMSGSGTTLATAQLLGHKAIGFDADPLAVIISKAWCSTMTTNCMIKLGNRIMKRAKEMHRSISGWTAYPEGLDAESKEFVRFWFDLEARKQLTALACSIEELTNPQNSAIMWCAFSRMIITKERGVSLAMDVSHSRPHKVYSVSPVEPFSIFEKVVSQIAKTKINNRSEIQQFPAKIRRGDARQLPLKDESVDVVMTSPPYLNAIDYLRGHKLALVWMGYLVRDFRMLRNKNIGSRNESKITQNALPKDFLTESGLSSLPLKELSILRQYFADMRLAIMEASRVMRKGATAIYVVGDSNLKGVFIRNSMVVRYLGQSCGLTAVSSDTRVIPANRRYLPPPKSAKAGIQLSSRMAEEVIITFCKQ